MSVLRFAASKTVLKTFEEKINNPNLKDNFFSHSVNPVLNMILIYEILHLITVKFLSLKT